MIEIRCDENWENLINKSELQKIITIFEHLSKIIIFDLIGTTGWHSGEKVESVLQDMTCQNISRFSLFRMKWVWPSPTKRYLN